LKNKKGGGIMDIFKKEKGSPLIEKLIIFPFLLLFIFGVSYGIESTINKAQLDNVTKEAARNAVTQQDLSNAVYKFLEFETTKTRLKSVTIIDKETGTSETVEGDSLSAYLATHTEPCDIESGTNCILHTMDSKWEIGNTIIITFEKDVLIGKVAQPFSSIRLPTWDESVDFATETVESSFSIPIENDYLE
jgi:uncharacterized membrane protein